MLKEVKNHRIGLLGFMKSSIMQFFFDLIDFVSVVACFWTVFWLLYLCFLKDFVDITVYAISKWVNRIAWVLKIIGVNNLVPPTLRANNLHHSKDFDDDTESDDVFETSAARISVTSTDENRSEKVSLMTPHSSVCKLVNPRKIDLNSEDIQLRDVAYVSPVQQSYFKQKIFRWNFGRNRRTNSYSPQNYSMSATDFSKIKETIDGTPSAFADKVNLVNDESPERLGCCNKLFSFLKLGFEVDQAPPSVHYERF